MIFVVALSAVAAGAALGRVADVVAVAPNVLFYGWAIIW
jgi:hypothetical protein